MAKNQSNAHIYGDEAGGVWVAPKGTTPPVALAAPAAGWEECGWIHEDGIEESAEVESNVFRAWQGAKVIKRKISSNDRTFVFKAYEENAVTYGLKYRGQVPVVTGVGKAAVATITVKDQTVTDERAFLFDVVDGDVTKRFLVPSGAHEVSGSSTYSNGDITVLEITVTPTDDYFEVTNNPALTAVA